MKREFNQERPNADGCGDESRNEANKLIQQGQELIEGPNADRCGDESRSKANTLIQQGQELIDAGQTEQGEKLKKRGEGILSNCGMM